MMVTAGEKTLEAKLSF